MMVMSKILYRISNNQEFSRIFNQVFYTQIMLSEISKNLGNSSMTHTLLTDEQTMKKSKYIKHW